MSGGKVVAWVCFQPPGSADPEIYFQPDCPYPEPTADTGIWQPLVLQSDLAAAIARAEAAERDADWQTITEGLRLADQFFDGQDDTWEWDDGTSFPASKVRAALRAAIAAQQAEGE